MNDDLFYDLMASEMDLLMYNILYQRKNPTYRARRCDSPGRLRLSVMAVRCAFMTVTP